MNDEQLKRMSKTIIKTLKNSYTKHLNEGVNENVIIQVLRDYIVTLTKCSVIEAADIVRLAVNEIEEEKND